jgi:hypothetical protein
MGKFSETLNKNKRIFLECNRGNSVNPEKIERKSLWERQEYYKINREQ